MELTTFGRTGLSVSVAGLGCGGHSRLGLTNGGSQDQAIAVVQRALDLGINLIDTARAYGTEEIVGRALAGRRDEVIVSTKAMPEVNGHLLSAQALRGSVEKSLDRLQTDHVDLFFVHGVGVKHLEHCRGVLAPELARMREDGKIRYVAVSEAFARDTRHEALTAALDAGDDRFDVAMVGFNVLNPSARGRLLLATQAQDIGVLVMFAVRRSIGQFLGTVRDLAILSKASRLTSEFVGSGARRCVIVLNPRHH
jgi:L-galactose dehydrogenase